jgi:hypothetical protein
VPSRASCPLGVEVDPGCLLVECHSGLKRLLCSSMVRLLPVQPYDTMGSVLIEYDVRVQP